MPINSNNSFVAAVVIGSSKVTGIVGRTEPEGTINVLAHIATPSAEFIRKGRVFNVEKMTTSLKSIREQLEDKLNCKIERTYVAIDCMGIRSIPNSVDKSFAERETMTEDVVNSIMVMNREARPAEHTILETVALEYRLGTITTTEPSGVMTDSVKAQFLNIVCNTMAVETIENCFRKANFPIISTKIAATQLANLVTSEQERVAGCVVVDMGSETTSVAIYKGKMLRHLVVLPLGGANVTRDIANVFQCQEPEAEELKRTYGLPASNETAETGNETIALRDGGRTCTRKALWEVIEARVEEIVQNVKNQIEISGYNQEQLVNGIYVIGGAAQLPNLDKALDTHFKDWNKRILKVPSRLSLANKDRQFNETGIYNVALALVENGTENCSGGERKDPTLFEPEETPESTTPPESAPTNEPTPEATPDTLERPNAPMKSWLSKVKNIFKSMVSDEDA